MAMPFLLSVKMKLTFNVDSVVNARYKKNIF